MAETVNHGSTAPGAGPIEIQAEIRIAAAPGMINEQWLDYLEGHHALQGLQLQTFSGVVMPVSIEGDRLAPVTALLKLARFGLQIRQAAVSNPDEPVVQVVNRTAAVMRDR